MYLIQVVDTIHILNDKQCTSWCKLVWIYIVCKGRAYPGSAGSGVILLVLHAQELYILEACLVLDPANEAVLKISYYLGHTKWKSASKHELNASDSSSACPRSDPGICSPSIHSVVLIKPCPAELIKMPRPFLMFSLLCWGFTAQSTQWGSCQARSVYLTTHLLGRFSPLSG